MAQVKIGVSGWQYPDFSERFYPEDLEKNEQLAYYADHFPTVEINNTFYQLPDEETVKQWRKIVPGSFIFAIKGNRYITHMKNLLEPENTLPKFFDRISLFGNKCGPILFQLPPQWNVNIDRLSNFLDHLPGEYWYTIELRNKTWHREEVYELLREHNVAFCIYEIDFEQSALLTTSDFVYIRLHGPGRAYTDPYDLEALTRWADRITSWVNSNMDVYCYFDNTHRGYAWDNGQTLLDLLN